MARYLPPSPYLLIAWPLVEELFCGFHILSLSSSTIWWKNYFLCEFKGKDIFDLLDSNKRIINVQRNSWRHLSLLTRRKVATFTGLSEQIIIIVVAKLNVPDIKRKS